MIAVQQALTAFLQTDATLASLAPGGLWSPIPDSSQKLFPYVSWQWLETAPVYGIKALVHEDFPFIIKGVDEAQENYLDYTRVEQLKDRFRALLHGATLEVAGHTFWNIRFLREIPSYSEQDDGRTLLHGGSEFRIRLR
jgi:hypothetical protein